jgi:hypothetical protein
MSHPVHTRARRFVAPVALAGAIAAGAFAVTPAAFASHVSSVGWHVHRADVALQAVASAAAAGNVSIPLSEMTAQLGVAANISAKLAAHVRTPDASQIAASALTLVAREEAKAEVKLTAELSAVATAEKAAVAEAAIKVAQSRELGLSVLAQLASQVRVRAHAQAQVIANEVVALSSVGQSLLATLVNALEPRSIDCPSVSVLTQLAASETASVRADLTRAEGIISLLGNSLSASVSQLASVTAKQIGHVNLQLQADANCQLTNSNHPGGSSRRGASTTS